MKRILGIVVSLYCMFSLAFSANITNITTTDSIYFCTRDALADSSVIDSTKVGDINLIRDQNYGLMLVVNRNDSSWHQMIRHCIALKATEIHGIKDISEDTMVLQIRATLGCYPIHEKIEVLVNGTNVKRNKMVCGDENFNMLDNVTVSCIPVLQEGMKIRKSNLTIPVLKEDVEISWPILYSEIYGHMRNNPGYDRDDNNCCSACLNGFRELRDSNSTDFDIDLSVINVRDFNFCGRGIKFDPKAESRLDYVEGISRSISDSVSSFFKRIFFVKRKQFVMPTPTPTLTGGDEPEEKEL